MLPRLVILVLAGACMVPAVRAAFTNVTALSGLDYLHGAVVDEALVNFASAAAVDVDGDGWTDLIVSRLDQRVLLFINQGDGTFAEEAVARGLGDATHIGGIGAGDFDNDGDPDLFMGPMAGNRCFLFINDGTGNFTEQAEVRDADLTTTAPHRVYSIGLVDFDRDGWLDIHFGEWRVHTSSEDHLHSVLLRNRGNDAPGYFENVTEAAGMQQPREGQWHWGFSSCWADFDGDGWPDLALISDFGTSQLFWNNGDGTFTETGSASGVGLDENGMGVAVADYDFDGRLDFFVSSIFHDGSSPLSNLGTTGNKLYRNLGDRRFEEVALEAGVANASWGWGSAFLDHDNDGDPDLVVTNGMVREGFGPLDPGESLPIPGVDVDRTRLFVNQSDGTLVEQGVPNGIVDNDQGRGLVVWDYDNDGDEDLFIANAFSRPVLYRNDASDSGNNWMRLRFEGVLSNRDGIGAEVRLSSNGRTQVKVYNPANAYLGQREPVMHFGLGPGVGTVESVEVLWPSGATDVFPNLPANQVHVLTEPEPELTLPVIDAQPAVAGALFKGDRLVLTVEASGYPKPVYTWQKDGVTVAGANQSTLEIDEIHPYDAGTYRVSVINSVGTIVSDPVEVDVTIDVARYSVARWWNEFLLDALRRDLLTPTVMGRDLFHVSAAMWDAFWAYEEEGWTRALPAFHREDVAPADWIGGRLEAQRQAISYAAYRVLTQRYEKSPGRERSLFGARWLMEQLGYDPDFVGTTGNSPAAVGNRIGYGVLAATLDDGSNEAGDYADTGTYSPRNDPLSPEQPGTVLIEPNHWQPISLQLSVTKNGIVIGAEVQEFLTPQWRAVEPFALHPVPPGGLALDPGSPPRLDTPTEPQLIAEVVEVIELSSLLDPSDAQMIDISPGALGNNPPFTDGGTGHPLNPYTDEPYEANLVKRADYARATAEFWSDGPGIEGPPGFWNMMLNQVTDHPLFQRRYAGQGPELSPLEWDVRAYFALNGAMHDCGVAVWAAKYHYDFVRPISLVRHLGALGQSSDPAGPTYHPQGLPLVPNLIEVVTDESAAPGGRHAHLAGDIGKIAVRAWRGQPALPDRQTAGVGWILAEKWMPYQTATFVTPNFPGYVSGHSTYSRAAAEVLTLLTGSPFFPGGLMEFHFEAGAGLRVEQGPTEALTLQCATYQDAADQTGFARLLSGVHIAADDYRGRWMGARIGMAAFVRGQHLRNGAALPRGIINISTRAPGGAGENVVIAGFAVEGVEDQPMLLRTVGPELATFGIEDFDPDPSLEVYRSGENMPFLVNDDWNQSPRAAAIADQAAAVGAFSLDAAGLDAAELVDLAPGLYTVISRSADPAARGIALAEVYGERLINVSTRARVGSSEAIAIAGFVVRAQDPTPLLVRGAGPALANLGVGHPLPDPFIRVFRHLPGGGAEEVAANNDWGDDPKASAVLSAAEQVGAFSFTAGSTDAALLLQLPSGTYSAHLTAADGTEGVGLVEVYYLKD